MRYKHTTRTTTLRHINTHYVSEEKEMVFQSMIHELVEIGRRSGMEINIKKR